MDYQIVPFKDNDLTLDVRVDIIDKTIWLSIPEIAILFAKSRTTISKKIKTIYDQNILKKEGTCAKNAHMPQDLFRSYEETFYNLDLIKEIGILMKSNKGVLLEQFLFDYLSSLQLKNDGTIIIYNNGCVSLDVTVSPEENTVWIAKENLVDLFETTRQNIDYHITKIYEQNELAFGATCKEILQVQIEGGREVNRLTQLYNLDMVISLGYRINTKKGIEFRRWATNVLKKYLLNGYAIDEQRVLSVRNIVKLENDVKELKEKVDDIEKKITNKSINGKLFAQGTYYDAHEFICSLIMKAEKELIIVDPYFDLIGLSMLEKSKVDISRIIIISKRASLNEVDINRFTSQYGQLEILFDDSFHDRFLIIDREEFYSLGTSLNYLGNKIFGVNKIEEQRMTDLLMDIVNKDIEETKQSKIDNK